MTRRLVLTGLSGTGKSTAAKAVAASLGWHLVDTDDEIERTAGVRIPEIFANEGESRFRVRERTELRKALDRDQVVIATGGGAVVAPDAWDADTLGRPDTLIVALDAQPEVLVERLAQATAKYGDNVKRPLLDAQDPLALMREMRSARSSAYSRSHVLIPVDRRSATETADDLTELVRLSQGESSQLHITTDSMQSTIEVGPDAVNRLPAVLRDRWPKAQQIWLAVDEHVQASAAELAVRLRAENFRVQMHAVPSGEQEKSIDGLAAMWNWLLDGGVQRSDVLVALGGGKVGDLAGFAAATVLRGIGLVQIPTTLLAMVDSSIGGKTAINHTTGKNLIGAFYQPAHVLIDPTLLASLPAREFASGWAEVIKHGEIQRSTPGGATGHLREVLHLNAQRLQQRDHPLLSWVIRQNLTIKSSVVQADEKEQGLRAILNYGHTYGHAIEASGYRYLHGEAIAIGLHGAVRLASHLNRIHQTEIERIQRTLERYQLPIYGEGDVDAVLRHMGSDKKKQAGEQQWVLANSDGGVDVGQAAPADAVRQIAAELLNSRV